ncbi:10427_t:CDS:2 [Entrophospora sp. SA101]|nr:10427_t:CDS:2 [Entrophospora sp. SA101]
MMIFICNALKTVIKETNKKYFEQPVWQTLNIFIGNDNSKGNGVIVDDDGYSPLPQGNSQTSIDNTDINSNADDIIVEEDINVPTKELKGWKILLFLVSNNV